MVEWRTRNGLGYGRIVAESLGYHTEHVLKIICVAISAAVLVSLSGVNLLDAGSGLIDVVHGDCGKACGTGGGGQRGLGIDGMVAWVLRRHTERVLRVICVCVVAANLFKRPRGSAARASSMLSMVTAERPAALEARGHRGFMAPQTTRIARAQGRLRCY